MNGYFYFSDQCKMSIEFNKMFRMKSPEIYSQFKIVSTRDKRNQIPSAITKTPALAINIKGQWTILQGMNELINWLNMVCMKSQTHEPMMRQAPNFQMGDPLNDPRFKDTSLTHKTDLGFEGLDSSGISSDYSTLDLAYSQPKKDPNQSCNIPFNDQYAIHDMNFQINNNNAMPVQTQGNRGPGNQNNLPPQLRSIDSKSSSNNEMEMKMREYQEKRGAMDQLYGIKSNYSNQNENAMSRVNN